MSRIRNVKPEYFKHEKIATLPRDIRLLFIGLWTQADLHGVFEWRPRALKLELFPWDDDISAERVDAMMAALVVVGVVRTFMHESKKFGAIHDWLDHQAISVIEKKQRTTCIEKGRAVYPQPPDEDAGTGLIPFQNRFETVPEPFRKTGRPDAGGQNRFETVPEPYRNTGRHDVGVWTKENGHHDVVTSDVGGETTATTAAADYEPHDSYPGEEPKPSRVIRDLTTAIVVRVDAIDTAAVRAAVKAGALMALISAFRANLQRSASEWELAADSRTLHDLVVLFAEARNRRSPIREPSGLRAAIDAMRSQEWAGSLSGDERVAMLASFGIKPPTPTVAKATA